MSEIKVSIICNAYNHEKYIKDALEGFVMQQTNFDFEVLVHDDASTDATADIIREYEKKYPELIKPIYETENQYSKNDDSLKRIQYGRVQGKYIALCEGDDYWTDPQKLQKQYDILENNPDINICATVATLEKNGLPVGKVSPRINNTIIPVEEVIVGDGGFVATATLMYRTAVRNMKYSFFHMLGIDYVLQIAGSLFGGMIFLSDDTAVYRLSTEGSWTKRMLEDKKSFVRNKECIINMLMTFDDETRNIYHKAVENRISKYQFDILLLEKNYRKALDKKYKPFFSETSFRTKMCILVGCVSPKLSGAISHILNKFNSER